MDARSELDTSRRTHLDYGYAVTSHSSQGQTADRVLVHVDTELGAKDLLSSRMAYVSISRGAQDAQIFTNDASALGKVLSRDVSKGTSHRTGSNRLENRATVCSHRRNCSGTRNRFVERAMQDDSFNYGTKLS